MSKVIGSITRGTTAPNRLRRIDRWLLHTECSQLRRDVSPIVVDLGYGASPITTAELRDRLVKHVRPDLKVVGIEIDPERVRAAEHLRADGLDFIRGGFEIPIAGFASVIRAANVLRQYDVSEVLATWEILAKRLTDTGLLIDATCDEIGRRAAWVAIRKSETGKAIPISLTIAMHLDSLEKPSDVAARLPKILIHENQPGQPIHAVLQRLDEAWERTISQSTFGARAHWLATLDYATSHGLETLDTQSRWRLGEITIPWAAVSSD